MVRSLSIVASVSFVGAIALLTIDPERFAVAAVVLLIISIPLGGLLGLRRGYGKARSSHPSRWRRRQGGRSWSADEPHSRPARRLFRRRET